MGFGHKFNSSEECDKQTLGPYTLCPGINMECYHGFCQTRLEGGREMFDRCNCTEGWKGNMCDFCCMLPCVNGQCDFDAADDMMFCNCDSGYFGPYCENAVTTTTVKIPDFWNPYTYTAVILPLCLALLLLVGGVMFVYTLYRKRHLLILKIIYKFKKTEDDDSKTYDVFLSYRTSNAKDRNFVIYKLLKNIEDWGFTTCIDERDFIPGGAIVETIKVAIQESRRTILVLSPAYLQGQWPEFEVQCAIIETLTKTHRIIPIIYEPIDTSSETISSSLKHILESITYIEWPQNEADERSEQEFWRRLKLSLPKKRKSTKADDILVPEVGGAKDTGNSHRMDSNGGWFTENEKSVSSNGDVRKIYDLDSGVGSMGDLSCRDDVRGVLFQPV